MGTFLEEQLKSYDLTEKELNALYKEMLDDYKVTLKKMKKRLKKVYINTLSGVPPDQYLNTMMNYGRLEALILDLQNQYNTLVRRANTLIKNGSKLEVTNSFYRRQYILNWVTPVRFQVIPEVIVNMSALSTPKVWEQYKKSAKKTITKKYGNITLYKPKHGTLIDVLLSNKREKLVEIRRFLNQELLAGNSFKKSAKGLTKLMDNSLSNALRIVRTEGTRNMNAGAFALSQYAKSEGVDLETFWKAVLDIKTRVVHGDLDSTPQNNEGYFVINGDRGKHPGDFSLAKNNANCRCGTYDKVKGIPLELRRAKNPVTGKTDIITYKSYNKWLKDNNMKRDKYGRIVKKAA